MKDNKKILTKADVGLPYQPASTRDFDHEYCSTIKDELKDFKNKQIPKQIDLNSGECPICKYDMYKGNYKDNYCPNCGQRIDWD